MDLEALQARESDRRMREHPTTFFREPRYGNGHPDLNDVRKGHNGKAAHKEAKKRRR